MIRCPPHFPIFSSLSHRTDISTQTNVGLGRVILKTGAEKIKYVKSLNMSLCKIQVLKKIGNGRMKSTRRMNIIKGFKDCFKDLKK